MLNATVTDRIRRFKYFNDIGGYKLHSDDHPAIDNIKGDKIWYHNGAIHNANGPAIEFASGANRYYLDGQQVLKADWETLRQSAPGFKPDIPITPNIPNTPDIPNTPAP